VVFVHLKYFRGCSFVESVRATLGRSVN
jgi:hypothetical protein